MKASLVYMNDLIVGLKSFERVLNPASQCGLIIN